MLLPSLHEDVKDVYQVNYRAHSKFPDFENLSQKHPTLQLIRVKIHFRPIFSYRKEFGSNLPGEEIVNRRSQNPWLPLVQAIEQQGQITCIPILWRTLLRPLCLQTKPRYTLSDNNQHHHHENDLSFTIPIKINYWFLWHCICLQT